MATFKRFEDIEVWKLARALAVAVYGLTQRVPFAHDYGLKDQIQRASVSVGSNIAEGFERSGNKDFVKFLWIAKGSVGEVRSQCYTAFDLGYLSQEDFDIIEKQCKELAVKIFRLIESIENSQLAGVRYRIRDIATKPSTPRSLAPSNTQTIKPSHA